MLIIFCGFVWFVRLYFGTLQAYLSSKNRSAEKFGDHQHSIPHNDNIKEIFNYATG